MNGSDCSFRKRILNIRAGKASPQNVRWCFVDYYGSQTPISKANINALMREH